MNQRERNQLASELFQLAGLVERATSPDDIAHAWGWWESLRERYANLTGDVVKAYREEARAEFEASLEASRNLGLVIPIRGP